MINFIGTAHIKIDENIISFDIVPVKFQFTEYKQLTEEIADFCEQLLLEWTSPTSHKFIVNPEEEKKVILEQFLFLRSRLSMENLDYLKEMILRNPHRTLESEWGYRDSSLGASPEFFSDPIRYGKDWYRVTNQNTTTISGYLPEKILSQRKYDSFDTPPNRFLKFALEYFLNICNFIEDKKPSLSSVKEAKIIKEGIEQILSAQMFLDVGILDYIPFNNQTLLKREGYRQILEIYNLVENALSLSWDGNREAFDGNNRGIDVLYEYWVYIKIFEILKKSNLEYWSHEKKENQFIQIGKDQMSIYLKEGKETISIFIDRIRKLRIHFYYNRTFTKPADKSNSLEGSYSRTFRPDYSIVIMPLVENLDSRAIEEEAIKNGTIAYLHFDAKYRLDRLEELFSKEETNPEAILEEKRFEKSIIYKNGDLYKMHAYNEAIRKSIGSYIIYPGDTKYEYKKYYEILPGVGAFPMSPKKSDEEIRAFLQDIFDHQASRFTQSYRISYFTHDTLKNYIGDVLKHSYTQYPDKESLPPEDIYTLVGYIRKEEIEFVKQNQVFFFHAIRDDKVIQQDKDLFKCSFFVGFANVREVLPWYAKIKSISLKKREEILPFRNPNTTPTQGVSHYYLVELETPMDMSPIKAIDDLEIGKPIVKKWNEILQI
ncbi:MAG TPA: DUF2357 domain-containing protein [Leptospiraceae bacterium]|nr:DUF2357 domain-containing protein [Leptospiraceae bacterium]HNE56775.1 DUF2357 domain-containing protein [Leptospiraceae bacterium]HNF57903.1 DUF2357 domain-containing protein [Leptospiraceae bacterium]HNH02642.1 DUF2357 domain-containing protein [Leptospiraceae bacterium]HNM88086.1 DUF2357 domain-containing protein [Leptospiraceae bacterium]